MAAGVLIVKLPHLPHLLCFLWLRSTCVLLCMLNSSAFSSYVRKLSSYWLYELCSCCDSLCSPVGATHPSARSLWHQKLCGPNTLLWPQSPLWLSPWLCGSWECPHERPEERCRGLQEDIFVAQLLSVFHLMLCHQKQPFLPLQTSIVSVNSTLLWTDLHVKFEPFSHLVISGLISLLRLKVLGTSTLCSSVLVCWMLRVWLSCSHSTVRGRGKKPLRVQMSLTAVAPHSQTWCSVMLGDTVRGSEIKMRLVCL